MKLRDKNRTFLALGSNIGSRDLYLEQAVSMLSAKAGMLISGVSSIYESPAAGDPEQADYLNKVLEAETWLEPMEVLDLCLSVENEMGRTRKIAKGPRNIDVDILLYSGIIMKTDALSIPHLELNKRPFFLVPLKELLGDIYLPGCNRRISETLAALAPYEISVYNGKPF